MIVYVCDNCEKVIDKAGRITFGVYGQYYHYCSPECVKDACDSMIEQNKEIETDNTQRMAKISGMENSLLRARQLHHERKGKTK